MYGQNFSHDSPQYYLKVRGHIEFSNGPWRSCILVDETSNLSLSKSLFPLFRSKIRSSQWLFIVNAGSGTVPAWTVDVDCEFGQWSTPSAPGLERSTSSGGHLVSKKHTPLAAMCFDCLPGDRHKNIHWACLWQVLNIYIYISNITCRHDILYTY